MDDHEALYGHHERRLSLHHAHLARHAADMLQLRMQARKILRRSSFFTGFSLDTVKSIVERLEKRTFQPHARICSQGDESSEFYLIMQGTVRIFQSQSLDESLEEEDKDVIELALLKQYECFGETALKPMCRKRTASASAVGVVEMLVLTRDRFVALSKKGLSRMEKRGSMREDLHRKKDESRRLTVVQQSQIRSVEKDKETDFGFDVDNDEHCVEIKEEDGPDGYVGYV
jgi:CRP-like cAMP-binding protein